MSADDLLKQAVADILSAETGLGVSATFTPASGPAVSLDVHFRQQSELQPSGTAQTWEIGSTIEYALADLGREALVGETFTIASAVWTVRKVESADGYAVKVVVS